MLKGFPLAASLKIITHTQATINRKEKNFIRQNQVQPNSGLWLPDYMVWSNNSQDSTGSPCNARTGIVRAPHGNLQLFSYLTGSVRGRTGPARVPYDTFTDRKGNWRIQNWQKSRTGVVFGRTWPVRGPHGLFTGWLQYLNPYGAHNLIMHALKLYGPRMGRQNSYIRRRTGPVRAPWVDVSLRFCSKQPENSPYGARECEVTEALVTSCLHLKRRDVFRYFVGHFESLVWN